MTRRQQEHQATLLPSAASDLTKPTISVGKMRRDREVEQPQSGNHKTSGVSKGKAMNEMEGEHISYHTVPSGQHSSSTALTVLLSLMQITPY